MLPLPCMSKKEIELTDKIFALRMPVRILEWGTGWSTVRWSKYPSVKTWIGIEHNPEWISKISRDIDPVKVKLGYANISSETVQYASKESVNAYVNHPLIVGKFELIIIDGDYRIQCFEKANELLCDSGMCLVHDTARKYMHEYFHLFKHHRILTEGEFNANNDWHQGLTLLWNADYLTKALETI